MEIFNQQSKLQIDYNIMNISYHIILSCIDLYKLQTFFDKNFFEASQKRFNDLVFHPREGKKVKDLITKEFLQLLKLMCIKF